MRSFVSLGCRFVLLMAGIPLWAQATSPRPASVPPLTTIGAVRALPADEAARALPVVVQGILTYNSTAERNMFIQDATGFMYVQPDRGYNFAPGTRVAVTGTTSASYTTQIIATSVRAIARGKLPEPVSLSYEEAVLHENDCRYVSVEGVVRAASLQTTRGESVYLLQLEVDGKMMDAAVSQYSHFDPNRLLDATVRIAGVLGGTFDVRDQIVGLELNVTDSDAISLVKPAEPASTGGDSAPLAELLRSDEILRPRHRVFTSGIVTLYVPGELLVIQDGDHSLFVHTRQMDPISIGQRVEVTGFLSAENGSPALELGQFSPRGEVAPLAPRAISFADAMSGKFANDLVALEGQIISQTRESHLDTIILRSDDRVFQTVFRKRPDDPDPIPVLQPGTRIRAIGVCVVHVRGFWGAVESFQIHLRTPGDIAILAPASWWTVARLLFLTSILLAIVLIALGWGFWMRRRLLIHEKLLRQNVETEAALLATRARLERQRSHILELINSFQPLEVVLSGIQAFADEMWPEATGYSHILRNRKLVLMCRTHLSPDQVARLEVVDPACSSEACAQAVRTRGLLSFCQTHSVWSRPIFSRRGEILGTMTFEARVGTAPRLNNEALDFACNLAAIAIDSRRLYEEVVHRSEHDPLTGLPNRSLLDTRLERALRDARDSQRFAAVLYLDLDDFKQVNDSFSHRIGDLYLLEVTQRFEACLRDCDTLSRVGGDEFIVVLSDLPDLDQARNVADRLVETLRTPLLIEGAIIPGSVSVGMAVFPLSGKSSDEITNLADRAMYEAKRAGGDRVSISEPTLVPN